MDINRYCQEKIVTLRNIYARTSINNIPNMPHHYEKKEGTRRICKVFARSRGCSDVDPCSVE
ncbi:hypothetical protein Avbf_17338 [Armadillidium vulgare]|nr:hypothetical protein Avbf_17338 [Armadillidium vulgare]